MNNNRVTYRKELRSYGSYTYRLTDFSTYQYKINRNRKENQAYFSLTGSPLHETFAIHRCQGLKTQLQNQP